VFTFENLELFVGAHGFTGPPNRGESASFGFHEGVNWGSPLPFFRPGAFGAQVGFRAVQSNFEGTQFTNEYRGQTFLTAGVFRRVDLGLQGGVVVDQMHDEWCYGTDLTQIRGLLSWIFPGQNELGFWFAEGTNSDDVASAIMAPNGVVSIVPETMTPTDLYAFFYRHRFHNWGGFEGGIFAGFTGESDGLIGAEFRTPLTPNFSLESEFTYLAPEGSAGTDPRVEESWNVAISIVWFPGCRRPDAGNYFRPLFDVAGNGTFLVDRQ
jgi:hypothetical protein